jgi:biopolymer transport protein ExbD
MKIKRKEAPAEIPTSSMADIAFLLIIFFMVTAVFSATKGLNFKLPSNEDDNKQAETEEAVFVKIAADGSFTMDCKPMDLDGIIDYLEPKLTRDAEKPVILYTDPFAPYQSMIDVYDILILPERTDADLAAEDPPQPPRYGWKVKNISVPTQTEIQDYIGIFGYNPFEAQCEG